MDDLIGKRLGHYEIIAAVGRGGMATVYRARQMSIQRDVAIKVITEKGEPGSAFLDRFNQEIAIIARLEHLHILPIYDYGELDGNPYLVMRYLDGGTLHTRIAQKTLDLADIERLVAQICSALDYAHDRGVVHRDMKPHNILLDRQGNAYICDFGIAKIVGGEHALTRTGEAVGTPSYMAPEQWQGLSVDRHADIYAMGAMLFEMLAGTPPFEGENVFTLMYKHLNEPPPLVSRRRANLSAEIDLVIQQAMAKLPDERFESAGALAQAVSAVLHPTSPAPQGHVSSTRIIQTTPADDTMDTEVIGTPVSIATGRAWAFDAFEAWRRSPDESPIFYLVGPHGMGKSTLTNRFVELLGQRILRYELVTYQARSLEPRVFIESLVAQLIALIPGLAAQSAEDALHEAFADPVEAFERQVIDPLSDDPGPTYLLIDNLDAAFDHLGTGIVDLIRAALEHWPESLRLIVTSVPQPRLDALFRNARRLELDPGSDENRADLRSTLSTRFATLLPHLSRGEVDLLALEDKSEGNPLYLSTVLEHLVLKRIQPADLADLPAGLDALYADLTRRAETANAQTAPLLRVLAAVREPLSERVLAEIMGETVGKTRACLMALRPLAQTIDSGWNLSHPALRYWLLETDEAGIVAAHQRIADVLLNASPAQMDIYALQNLPTHLVQARQPQRAYALLTDLNFLAARLTRISLADAVDDFDLVQAALRETGDTGDAENAARLDAVLDALHEALGALSADLTGIFGQLYNVLIGIPGLSGNLSEAAGKRRAPWLRLIWPPPAADRPRSTIAWHGESVMSLSAAGTPDNPRWLAACGDGSLRFWEGGQLTREWAAHSASLTSCALSADGNLALSAGEDSEARLWDMNSGECMQIFGGHKGIVHACDLSDTGQYALTASDDRLLRLWNTQTGRLVHAFYEHPAAVKSCAFAGKLALSGAADGVVRVWDVAANELRWTLSKHRGIVTACAGAPDMTLAATGATDGQVCVWDLHNGSLVHTLTGPAAGITALIIGHYHNTPVIVAASEDRTVRVWELEHGEQIARFEGHRHAALSCALEPEGRVLSGGQDGTLRLWSIPDAAAHPAVDTHSAEVRDCAFDAEVTRVLSASLDRELRLWEVENGRLMRLMKGHTGGINACALRPDGRVGLSASSDRTLRLWDLERASLIRLLTGHGEAVLACAFSPKPIKYGESGRSAWLAVSGGADRAVRLWDTETGQALTALRGHRDSITACVFSPVDEIVASIAKDRCARLWSLETGEAVRTIEADGALFTACAFSPDGHKLILGLDRGELWFFDRASGDIEKVALNTQGAIRNCGLSPNGRIAFAVAADGALRLWDMNKAQPLATFRGKNPLTCAAFAADGVTFAAGDSKGAVYLIRLEGQPGGRRKASLL